jgi:hypothetical protein
MSGNPIDYFAIQNTIAKYCIALDEKDFDSLRQVFTEDVDTVYPFRGSIKGVQEVADAIKKRYVLLFASFTCVRSFNFLLRAALVR